MMSKNIAVSTNDITSVFLRMNTIFSLREHACFILARKIFHNKRQSSALNDFSDVYAEKENTSRKKSKIH